MVFDNNPYKIVLLYIPLVVIWNTLRKQLNITAICVKTNIHLEHLLGHISRLFTTLIQDTLATSAITSQQPSNILNNIRNLFMTDWSIFVMTKSVIIKQRQKLKWRHTSCQSTKALKNIRALFVPIALPGRATWNHTW